MQQVVEDLPLSYSRATDDSGRLAFSRPSVLALRSPWRGYFTGTRFQALRKEVDTCFADIGPTCCLDSDAISELLSSVRLVQAYNRIVTASQRHGLARPFPVVTLEKPWASCDYDDVPDVLPPEEVTGRDQYSHPIAVRIGGKVKYGYFSRYGTQSIGDVPKRELARMIEQSIARNRSDASEIFTYTQKKRAARLLAGGRDNAYFVFAEHEDDKYDCASRSMGPLPCTGGLILFRDSPVPTDRFGATGSGIVHLSPSHLSSFHAPIGAGPVAENGVTITMIGHASVLVQFEREGVTVLTDPVFHDLNTVLYPRRTAPAFAMSSLPAIDVIVISHNHRDHVDERALRFLAKQQPLILVPLGDRDLMRRWGFLRVQEHSTWAETKVPFDRPATAGCEEHGRGSDALQGHVGLVSVPANHWSCRSLNDANLSLFLGWVFYSSAGSGSVYFAGDTALLVDQDVEDIARTAVSNGVYPPIMVNLQPGGPNHERPTMENTHTSAADGVFCHFQHALLTMDTDGNGETPFTALLEHAASLVTMFMHHNVFELGVDRFNEALFVREHFLNALAHHDSDEPPLTTLPGPGNRKEPVPQFVHDVVKKLLAALAAARISHTLTDSDSGDYSSLCEFVNAHVISPKIASTTYVPYSCL